MYTLDLTCVMRDAHDASSGIPWTPWNAANGKQVLAAPFDLGTNILAMPCPSPVFATMPSLRCRFHVPSADLEAAAHGNSLRAQRVVASIKCRNDMVECIR